VTPVVLIGLGVMWAVLLVPGWVRAWRERSGRPTTIDTFHHQLDVLGRDAPSRSVDSPPGARLRVTDRFSNHQRPRSTVPQDAGEAATRRRDIIVLLSIVAVISLVGWLVSGIATVGIVHIGVDAVLGLYAYVVVLRRRAGAEGMAKVHYLPRNVAEAESPRQRRRRAN